MHCICFGLIVTLVLCTVFVLFDCYVSAMHLPYTVCVLFDCYVSAMHCVCVV